MSRAVRGFVCIAGLCIVQQSAAQMPTNYSFESADTLQIEGTKRGPHWVVKFSPLSIIDVESIYRVDVERLLRGRFSVQAGLGYGNLSTQPWQTSNSNVSDRETWRAQLEGRMYVNRDRPATRWRPRRFLGKSVGQYVAIETFYKQVNAYFNGTLSRGCEDGNCQFFESYTARAIRYVVGSHLKIGWQWPIRLSETNNRLLIDYYLGIGARWRWFEQRGVPQYEDARPTNFFGTNRDPTSNWGINAGRYPSLAFGVQIGYAF